MEPVAQYLYIYKVEHIGGKQNVIADSLSRLELPAPDTGLEAELDDLLMNIDVGPTSDAAGTQASRSVWEIAFGTEDETEVRDASDADVGLQDVHPDVVGSYNVAEMQQRCPDCMPLLEYIKTACCLKVMRRLVKSFINRNVTLLMKIYCSI